MTSHVEAAAHAGNGVRVSFAPGFEAVHEQFSRIVDDDQEKCAHAHGSAVSIVLDGVRVVDLWAGELREGTPRHGDSRQCVFSCSKAITTLCVLHAADHKLLDLDAPVSRYWPEFAQHGKGELTVREMLAHRAGLPAPDRPFTHAEIAEWFPIVNALAAQYPLFEPGAEHSYHAITWGFLVGEVLRRATGLLPSEYLGKYVTGPRDIAVCFGAAAGEFSSLGRFAPPPNALAGIPVTAGVELSDRAALANSAYAPHLFAAANRPEYYAEENPAANAVASARDLADLMYQASLVDTLDPIVSRSSIEDALRPVSRGARYLSVDDGKVWGAGFYVPNPTRPMFGASSFGHDGAGGQLIFGDVEHRAGFAFLTTLPGGAGDERANSLAAAARAALV